MWACADGVLDVALDRAPPAASPAGSAASGSGRARQIRASVAPRCRSARSRVTSPMIATTARRRVIVRAVEVDQIVARRAAPRCPARRRYAAHTDDRGTPGAQNARDAMMSGLVSASFRPAITRAFSRSSTGAGNDGACSTAASTASACLLLGRRWTAYAAHSRRDRRRSWRRDWRRHRPAGARSRLHPCRRRPAA